MLLKCHLDMLLTGFVRFTHYYCLFFFFTQIHFKVHEWSINIFWAVLQGWKLPAWKTIRIQRFQAETKHRGLWLIIEGKERHRDKPVFLHLFLLILLFLVAQQLLESSAVRGQRWRVKEKKRGAQRERQIERVRYRH